MADLVNPEAAREMGFRIIEQVIDEIAAQTSNPRARMAVTITVFGMIGGFIDAVVAQDRNPLSAPLAKTARLMGARIAEDDGITIQ